MGNSNKKEEQPKKTQNQIRINHEKFSHFVYHEPEDLIEINLEAESEKDINRWDQDLKRVNTFQDKETLLLPNKHEYKCKGFCGNVGSVKIFYENYPYLFEEEIDNRIEMGKHFEEEELWYLLYSLCSSARDFSRIDSKIGDVRPYNIFINEEGQIKIANLHSWPYERTNFDKTAFEKQLTYLSPEEMRLISKGNHDNTTNKVTSESFSIGLTLLQSGLLFNAKELYSVEHYTIDLQKLSAKIGEWLNSYFTTQNNNNQGYSPLLKNIVAGLCHPDDKERLRSLQVEEVLRPYQNQILNLKEFEHQYVKLPVKMESFNSPPQTVQVQSRPPQIELGFNEPKYYQSMPQGNTVTVPQQKVFIANPIEPKLNSLPPVQISANEPMRPVSGQEFVRFNQGQPVNSDFLQGQFKKYASNQVQTSYRPQSIPVQAYEQQFTKYATMNGNPSPGITIPSVNATTIASTNYSQGGTNTINFTKGNNTLNQPSGLPTSNTNFLQPSNTILQSSNTPYQPPSTIFQSSNTTFQPSSLVYQPPNITYQPPNTTFQPTSAAFQSSTTNTFKEYTTSTYSRPAAIETFKAGSSIQGGNSEGSSDFLKKIDEQLEASRRQFPSS